MTREFRWLAGDMRRSPSFDMVSSDCSMAPSLACGSWMRKKDRDSRWLDGYPSAWFPGRQPLGGRRGATLRNPAGGAPFYSRPSLRARKRILDLVVTLYGSRSGGVV